MKYLISPLQLGQLLQEDDKTKRMEIIDDILDLFYIKKTDDKVDLNDHIEINKKRR